MSEIVNIHGKTSRGGRGNLIWMDGLLYGVPYRNDKNWYCANCNKEFTIPVKSINEICECGAYINWMPFIWS